VSRIYRYRFRAILRRRWRDYTLIALLIAMVGGLAMGSVVAGRRTQSAYGAFLARDNASTLTLSTYGLYNGSPANDYSPKLERAIRRIPEVAKVESWVASYVIPLSADGAPDLAALDSLNVAGSVDGAFFDEDRVTVIKGRMANPDDPRELMATALGARVLGVHLGETVPFGAYNASLVTQAGFGTPAVQPTARYHLRLVGIVEFNNSVVQDDTDRTPTNIVLTPALVRTQGNHANGTWFAVRLKSGVKDIGRVEQEMLRFLPPGALGQFYLTSVTHAKVESALRPESIALGVFGLIAALVVIGLCLPIMARLKVNSDDERDVLQSLGATRAAVAADFYIGVGAVVLSGTVIACVIAAGLASVAPLGPVHAVYHPGAFAIDWTVTALGTALLAGPLCAAAVAMAFRGAATRRARGSRARASQRSHVVDVLAAAGLPVPAVVGARFALEPGHGRTAIANRSVLAGGTLSVTLVVATLTFASGLNTLVHRPALYGWNWSSTLLGHSNVPPDALAALSKDPQVKSWAGYIAITTTVDGRSVPVLLATNGLGVTPPLEAGHAITGVGQIILGPATLAALHKRIGDTVGVGLGSPGTAPLYLPPQPLKIVGAATFPAVAGSSNFAEHTSMGVGGLFSAASLPPAFVRSTVNPDPVQNGPALVFVRYRAGTSRSAVVSDLRRITAIAARQFAADPQATGDSVSILPVQRPAAIVNYQATGATPLVLAFTLAAAATVALALSMVASVRRLKRDLAVLKTLGFVRKQMLATVGVQAFVTATVAVAVGVPLGVAAGRQLWVAFARSIYAVPEPTVPASVALAAAGAVAIAVAVAVIPGRLAVRTPAADVLRAD
jgi:hypothetical protein